VLARLATLLLRRWYVLASCFAAAPAAFLLTEWMLRPPHFTAACSLKISLRDGRGLSPAQLPQTDSAQEGAVALEGVQALRVPESPDWEIRFAGASLAEASARAAALCESFRSALTTRTGESLSRRGVELRARLEQAEQERALVTQALALAREPEAAELRARRDRSARDGASLESVLRRLEATPPTAYLAGKVELGKPSEARPRKPRRAAGEIALFCACTFGVALVAARLIEANDTRFRSAIEAQARLRLPALAAIPAVRPHGKGSDLKLEDLAAHPSFSDLAERIEVAIAQGNVRSLTLTSALDGEGKTTVSAGLAVALAGRGLQVTLVEGNLLQPMLHTLFQLENHLGLAGLLEQASTMGGAPVDVLGALSDSEVSKYAQQVGTSGLRVVCSGGLRAPIPLLLDRRKLQPLLLRLSRAADLVLCDSRALLSSGEALAFSSVTDATLLVLKSGRTEELDVAWARHLLRETQASTMGFVLNGCSRKQTLAWKRSTNRELDTKQPPQEGAA